MTFWQRLGNGMALCRHGLYVVLRDKTLLLFPLLSLTVTLLTIWMFYVSMGNDKIQLFVNTRVNAVGTQSLNFGYYFVVFLTYLVLYFVGVFCNAALAACAYISMTERDSKFRDGMRRATTSIPSLIVWSLISSTIGRILSVLDRERHLSGIIRAVLGSGWGVLTYFVVPVIEIERRTIFTALPRSAQVMKQTWGESATPALGTGWLFFLLNLPVLIALVWEQYYQILTPFVFLLTITWTLFSIVLVSAASNVLTVVLYLYANGQTPTGWNPERLQKAFNVPVIRPEGEEKAVELPGA